ncbi:MAG: SUMF1/EgtB/PvdO family nonheme iron enzyme [Anaerolineae bacterium]
MPGAACTQSARTSRSHWEVGRDRRERRPCAARHGVTVAPFRIGRFPVTNAEWAGAAGGYDDERWWATVDARRWRHGELAGEGIEGEQPGTGGCAF